MACFEWVSTRALPARWDLRLNGWSLVETNPDVRLVDGEALAWRGFADPSDLLLGVADSDARARWLALGFGEALPPDAGLAELDWRARALGKRVAPMHGPLRLDPLRRDAWVNGRRLHLHPREFILLWRLAAEPGRTVGREALLRDVFDLGFDPGTNRLAVHVCRLRKKLANAGLASLLVTGPGEGGYALMVDGAPASAGRNGLDAPGRLREHEFALEETAE